jgi:hypothetical protein
VGVKKTAQTLKSAESSECTVGARLARLTSGRVCASPESPTPRPTPATLTRAQGNLEISGLVVHEHDLHAYKVSQVPALVPQKRYLVAQALYRPIPLFQGEPARMQARRLVTHVGILVHQHFQLNGDVTGPFTSLDPSRPQELRYPLHLPDPVETPSCFDASCAPINQIHCTRVSTMAISHTDCCP